MLLHKQDYFQELREGEKEDVRDMILVAINEATKFSDSDSEKAEDFGVDFSNIPPINAIIIDDVLQSLGYVLDIEPELDGFMANTLLSGTQKTLSYLLWEYPGRR